MPSVGRMRLLTTVVGSFHGRVVAARLGAEGVLVQLKGVDDGPYPLQGSVEIYVPADQLDLAREILLADAVDDAFARLDESLLGEAAGESLLGRAADEVVDPGDPFEDDSVRDETGTGRARARMHGLAAVVAIGLVAVLVIVGMVAAAR